MGGQSTLIHPLILLSLRSRAARPGFWVSSPEHGTKADMVCMIFNPKKRLDDPCTSGAGPEACGKPSFFRSLQQDFFEFPKIIAVELGRSPRWLSGTDIFFILLVVCGFPVQNAPAINTRHARYISWLITLVKERYRSMSALLQSLWSFVGEFGSLRR